MSLESIFTSQISSYDTEITRLDGIITQIDAQGCTGELGDCLAQDKTHLMIQKTAITNIKTETEEKLARIQGGWTGDYLTYVNEIEAGYTGVYSEDFERFLANDATNDYTTFFTAYSQATNDFQKERLLKMTFHK